MNMDCDYRTADGEKTDNEDESEKMTCVMTVKGVEYQLDEDCQPDETNNENNVFVMACTICADLEHYNSEFRFCYEVNCDLSAMLKLDPNDEDAKAETISQMERNMCTCKYATIGEDTW